MALFVLSSNNSEETTTNQTSNQNVSNTVEPKSDIDQTYSLSEVATHDTEDDCWTIINQSVYDITSYVPRHPGGDEILLACGKDGTSLFENRRTEDGQEIGSGTPHGSSAKSQLEQYKIGTISN